MIRLPGTVVTYLQYHAPNGLFVGYWIDNSGEYNVVILCRHEGAYRFEVAGFPQEVGHWGHQLSGCSCDIATMKIHLAGGLWQAGEDVKERIRAIVERLEQGLDVADIVNGYRKSIDQRCECSFSGAAEPARQPQFKDAGNFNVIRALVDALAGEDVEIAGNAARRLASMGITEERGPLFARDALLKNRKRRQAPPTPASAPGKGRKQ